MAKQRICKVCSSPFVEQINNDLLASHLSYAELEKKYHISRSVLCRHKQHMKAQLMNRPETDIVPAEPSSIMQRLHDLETRAENIYTEAILSDDRLNAIRALQEIRNTLKMYAEITGELSHAQILQQNVFISPEWLTLRNSILQALEPFPEARQAVIEALNDD